MKRNLLLFCALLLTVTPAMAQSLATVTGLRLYEHHSHTICGPQGANGVQSGYDFVSRSYYNSFNTANFGPYLNGEEANIDMVEHNGPYGNGQNGSRFGFTSGMSTIWINEIKGNGTTKWMKAPATLNYATLNNTSQIATAFDAAAAAQSIPTVEENTTYLGRIRNTSLYVAMRVTTLKNKTTNDDDVYFDFEYKYGSLAPAGVGSVAADGLLAIYPNPAARFIVVENKDAQAVHLSIMAVHGQAVATAVLRSHERTSLDLSAWAAGLYFIQCTDHAGSISSYKLIKD